MGIDETIEWVSKRPIWQRDALRRIATSPELTDSDRIEILNNVLVSNGLPSRCNSDLIPLTEDHVQLNLSNVPLTHICSIEDIKNANCLAPDQTLPFALDGITLIYGQNGSGKSGYCRILKKFCRAIVKDTVHPNVFGTGTSEPAEALVRYKLAGAKDVREVIWRDGQEGPSILAHLSVFDSHNARLYVDERNRIDYLPFTLELLTRFGQLLTVLEESLSQEIQNVEDHLSIDELSKYTRDTEAFKLVARLSLQTQLEQLPTETDINSLGTWTEKHSDELKTLQQSVNTDPKMIAMRYRQILKRISSLIHELSLARDTLSESNVNEFKSAFEQARLHAETASLAATELFMDEPLSDVGSEPWRLMFFHAKEYSKLIFPNREPPPRSVGDRCLLCQQTLTEEAAERLSRFQSFLISEATKLAEKTASIRDAKLKRIQEIQIQEIDGIEALFRDFADLNIAPEIIEEELVEFVQNLGKRKIDVLAAAATGDFSSISTLDYRTVEQLVQEKQSLSKVVDALDATSENDSSQEEHQKELTELLDRKRLSENVETIRALRENLELRGKLEKCLLEAKTKPVSVQVNKLRKQLVTEDLNRRIRTEVKKFDLSHIPLLINDDSRKGISGFAIKLDAKQKVASRDVLSEGEQRALGLACFLADVNRQPVKHGIVVDDPVSSLDHVRLRSVAKRLVEEAASGRQVIVFTHNLLFFSEVMSVAAAFKPTSVPVLANVVRQVTDLGFGVVSSNDEPWEAKPTTKRISLLQTKVRELENMNDEDDDTYRRAVASIYSEIRQTWERLVEEMLFYKVVERYVAEVKTQRLRGVVVDDEDYRTIYWSMKRVSEFCGHDLAIATNKPLPSIEDIKEELSKLDEYRAGLSQRTKAVQKEREKIERPPSATTV